MPNNLLYDGDHMDILRRSVKDETIDLVYLDLPVKISQGYKLHPLMREY
jgi:hypothetical protein